MPRFIDDIEIVNYDYTFNITTDTSAEGASLLVNGNGVGISIKNSKARITISTNDVQTNGFKRITLQKEGYTFFESYNINLGDIEKDIENGRGYYTLELIRSTQDGQLQIITNNTLQFTSSTLDDGTPVTDSICKRYRVTGVETETDYSQNTNDDERDSRFNIIQFIYQECEELSFVRAYLDQVGDFLIIEAIENSIEPLIGKITIEEIGTVEDDGDGGDGGDGGGGDGGDGGEPDTSATVNITVKGEDNSVKIVFSESTELAGNSEKDYEITIGDSFEIVSADVRKYRIDKIFVKTETELREAKAESDEESLTAEISVVEDLEITIVTEKVIQPEKPSFVLANASLEREYNINSTVGVPIGLLRKSSLERLRVYISDKVYEYDVSGNVNSFVIPKEAFNKDIGIYKVQIIPNNRFGDGDSVDLVYNVFRNDKIYTPDIRNIRYPKEVIGEDYKGTDIPFEIEWESVNADYVRIYKSEYDEQSPYYEVSPSGKVQLNFKDLVGYGSDADEEDDDAIYLNLLLVPFNISGDEVIQGKIEKIQIKFFKSNLTIPRETAINRIVEGFVSQFDTSFFTAEDSKYLTHLLHIGSGNNLLISNFTGSENSLIVKLYEPLGNEIEVNQEVWISKIQSEPIIETVSITGVDESFCQPLKGPNFSLNSNDSIGFKFFDELIASGSYTSIELTNVYLDKSGIDTERLNIQYVENSDYAFENFVHFGSAEERVRNFFYKVKLVEQYRNRYEDLVQITFGGGRLLTSEGLKVKTEDDIFEIEYEINTIRSFDEKREAERVFNLLNETLKSFDGFEKYLYTSTTELAYPKLENTFPNGLVIYEIQPTLYPDVVDWYDNLLSKAVEYDRYNPNYLVYNIPEFIREDYQNEEFMLFLDMIGQHFDNIWAYINALNRIRNIDERKEVGIPNDIVWYMLKAMGWDGRRAYNSELLWEYFLGQNKDGFQKYSIPLKQANDEVWRRVLNNLPYLLKHKGTSRALKAIMACYGIPQSLLSIMEFGGPKSPELGNSTDFTFEDRTASVYVTGSSYLTIPWKDVNSTGQRPQSIEFRIKPDRVGDTTIITTDQFKLDIVQKTGSFVELQFNLGDGGSEYIETPFISASVSTTYFSNVGDGFDEYVLGPETFTASAEFPLYDNYWTNVLLNKYDYTTSTLYEILLKATDGRRILTNLSMSIVSDDTLWETGSEIRIGNGFTGEIDEVRLWKVPLQPSKFENHVLFPDAINGNSYTASTEDLIFRLDFERPQDLTSNPYIKNVSINETYEEPFATASLFYSASTYPYQYIPYERTVTAKVPSLGFTPSNKIRFEEQNLISDLSYRSRATVKSFDTSPIDSNRLGIFLSPNKELNMDIIKAFGEFNIDNYIGDPSDDYEYEYDTLKDLRTYYFERLERNIYEYIRLVRYIDKSLFDVLSELAPARAKVSKGLLIEPHFLERSKTKWEKPTSERGDYDAIINVDDNNDILFEYSVQEANLDYEKEVILDFDYKDILAHFREEDRIGFDVTLPMYSASIFYSLDDNIEVTLPMYTASIVAPTADATILVEVESLQLTSVGTDPNSLSNLGFGLYAENKTGLNSRFDLFGNYEKERENIFLVKERYTQEIYEQIAGWPKTTTSNQQVEYGYVDREKFRYKISLIPFGEDDITEDGNIDEVTPLQGYFPTHYIYVNGLGEGLERSYFKGSLQTINTTLDGLSPVETFLTNPNILRVTDTQRGNGEPILIVE